MADIKGLVRQRMSSALAEKRALLKAFEADESLHAALVEAASILMEAVEARRSVYFAGNGGSAADAQHFAAELLGRFEVERAAIPALSLATDTSALTALGNDYGNEYIFSRQIEAHGRPGDVLVGITTSGKSANIVRAFEAAHARSLRTIALCGQDGLHEAVGSDVCIAVPSRNTARIQEWHTFTGHVLCGAVEEVWAAAY